MIVLRTCKLVMGIHSYDVMICDAGRVYLVGKEADGPRPYGGPTRDHGVESKIPIVNAIARKA